MITRQEAEKQTAVAKIRQEEERIKREAIWRGELIPQDELSMDTIEKQIKQQIDAGIGYACFDIALSDNICQTMRDLGYKVEVLQYTYNNIMPVSKKEVVSGWFGRKETVTQTHYESHKIYHYTTAISWTNEPIIHYGKVVKEF